MHLNTNNSRFFLIGFMGSGKSTIGKALAKKLQWNFIDLDEVIELKNGKSIQTIFLEEGEHAFRKYEQEELKNIIQFDKVIIATGGGTPCFYDNINWMNAHGTTVYLSVNTDILFHRLIFEKKTRPLIQDLSANELKTFIENKTEERIPFYLHSKIKIQANISTSFIVDEIIKLVLQQ